MSSSALRSLSTRSGKIVAFPLPEEVYAKREAELKLFAKRSEDKQGSKWKILFDSTFFYYFFHFLVSKYFFCQ